MRDVIIAPQVEGKGRSFSAIMLACVEADGLWTAGRTATDVTRPVWAMFAGSDAELRTFAANLQTGRKAQFGKDGGFHSKRDEKIEFLKSAGYQYTWQRETEGSLLTAFLPDLFRLDPGMVDPTGATFVCLPTAEWLAAQKLDTRPLVAHVKRLGEIPLSDEQLTDMCPLAFLFCAYLDRRTRCPLLSDGRFYLQLLIACLNEGLASFPLESAYWGDRTFGVREHFRFRVEHASDVGIIGRPVAFQAKHEEIERVMSEQVAFFFKLTNKGAR